MRKINICLISIAAVLSLSGCVKKTIQTTGERITNSFSFNENLSSLEIQDIYLKLGNRSVLPEVNIAFEGERKVEITYEASLEKEIAVEKKENTLIIEGQDYKEFISKGVIINITGFRFDEIELQASNCNIDNYSLNTSSNCSISLSGASSLKIDSYNFLKELNLDLSGASKLEANSLSANYLDIDVNGASKMKVENFTATKMENDVSGASTIVMNNGAVKEVDMDISGASSFLCEKVYFDKAKVNISGASKANLSVISSLSGSLSGASSLIYSGEVNPNLLISGGSTVIKK